jgi:membrane protease YdiL (CAAX protease family)
MISRRPIVSYFVLTFAVSWTAALAVVAPRLLRGLPVPDLTGILMFPAMLLGPSLVGLFMTWRLDGRTGLRDLLRRMVSVPAFSAWYTALLAPPTVILTVLLLLKTFVSSVYAPNHFLAGVAFGVPAGILEEIGWTGFAYPRMRDTFGTFKAGVLLGCLWSLWHLPVIDFLSAARPHGAYLPAFFLSFFFAMTAIRIFIGWMYVHTRSVLFTQLMHISSTGALVVFAPFRATAKQETFWYFCYGLVLWIIVAFLHFAQNRRRLRGSAISSPAAGMN